MFPNVKLATYIRESRQELERVIWPSRDQLIRQVLQGGGNMPAYGNNLKPAEVTALVAFLETMHPKHQRPAEDSAVPAVPGDRSASGAAAETSPSDPGA